MRSLDFYEFAGILVPGTITFVGFVLVFPHVGAIVQAQNVSLGAFGLILVLAYALGHLVQAAGNLIEALWWKVVGGMPSDWVRSRRQDILSASQLSQLPKQIEAILRITVPDPLSNLNKAQWFAITRQIFAAVHAAGNTARVDTFNGNYGLNRGIGAALLVVVAIAFAYRAVALEVALLILVGAGIALYRMHRFGVHYARELLVQFLQLRP